MKVSLDAKTLIVAVIVLIVSAITFSFTLKPDAKSWKKYVVMITSFLVMNYCVFMLNVKMYLAAQKIVKIKEIFFSAFFQAVILVFSFSTFLFSEEEQCAYDTGLGKFKKNITYGLSIAGMVLSSILIIYVMYTHLKLGQKTISRKTSKLSRFSKEAISI